MRSDPPGAEVMLGPLTVGKTPYSNSKIRSGQYALNLSKDMYLPSKREVHIRPELTANISIKLAPDFGTLILHSTTQGAQAKLDQPPLVLGQGVRLRSGRHTLSLEAPYHYSKSKTLTINREQEIKLDWSLEPQMGALSITTEPPGAEIILDGKILQGTSPLVLREIDAGPHKIEARKNGFEAGVDELSVQPNQVNRVGIELKIEEPGLFDSVWSWFSSDSASPKHIQKQAALAARGGSASRYSKDSDGVITDSKIGLKWLVGPDRDTDWYDAKNWVENLRSNLHTIVNELSSDGRYTKDSKGVITDSRTDLQWFVDSDRNTDWREAKEWIENLRVSGGGWRMPSKNEVRGLCKKGARKEGPEYLPPIFHTSGSWAWLLKSKDSYVVAWSFIFNAGWPGAVTKDGPRRQGIRSSFPAVTGV